ncbi:HEPN domain-containing protein [Candidatus Sumerlaeota bacterium]|nr:HEPN domain-containing protein [Candidatus Sumerlaeota bacterium]
MKENQIDALLKYRMKQAKETLQEANILYNQKSFRGAINRAYYAIFYSVLAILTIKGLGSSKHSGVISLFDKEFIKTGILPLELSRILRMSFERRQSYDYGELIQIDEDSAREALLDADKFINEIISRLQKMGRFEF